MTNRVGRVALWVAAGFLLGAAALAGGEGEEDLREKLIEIERLCAKLRALEAEEAEFPAPDETGFEFACVHLSDVVAGVPDFHRPRRMAPDLGTFGGVAEEAPQPFGTVEEVMELVRVNVRPEAWEEGAEVAPQGPKLLLFAPPDVSRAVREFVDKELRPEVRRTVILEIEVVEADEPAFAAGAGGALDDAGRARLEEAIAAGKARRLFAGRLRALSRQQAVLWHGAETAVVADADVERAVAVDPFVDVELTGTIVEARSTVAEGRVRVQLSLDHTLLDRPVRAARTDRAGTVQLPARAATTIDADLWVAAGRWAVAGERTGADGKRRSVLVRPTVIGGAR